MTRRNRRIEDYISSSFGDYDWAVLKENIQNQFHELVKLPLSSFLPEGKPHIIMIDGLDECEGEEEQCEIVRCILDALQAQFEIAQCIPDDLRDSLRLGVRWLIFSRPEPHLKRMFETAESEGFCCTKEVLIDDYETETDIQLYLAAEFTRIAIAYLGVSGGAEGWPKQNDLDKVFKASFGLFVYAVTIVKFVGDPIHKDPVSRLQLVIDVIDGSPLPPGASNPLGSIDTLYRELIERTPPNLLATTLRILGTCIVCPHLPVVQFAHLLGLNWRAVYEAVISLHSVLDVPSEAWIAEEPLRFFHASFPDYLMNTERSGSLAQDPGFHRLQLVEICFRVLNHLEISYAGSIELSVDDDDDERIPSPLSMACLILTFASTHVWEICTRLRSPTADFLRRTVGSFDFRRLQLVCESIPPQGFIEFLRWLHRAVCSIL